MIDFKILLSADKYRDENIDEFFETCMRTMDAENWTEEDKEKFKLGLNEGMRHGYYNALFELKEKNKNETY